MTAVKRALRLRGTKGHPQALLTVPKMTVCSKIHFIPDWHLVKLSFFLFFFFSPRSVLGWGGYVCVGEHVCVVLLPLFPSLFFSFSPQLKEKERLKSPRSWVPSTPLKTLGRVKGAKNVVRRMSCYWVWMNLPIVGFIRILYVIALRAVLVLCCGQELVKGSGF